MTSLRIAVVSLVLVCGIGLFVWFCTPLPTQAAQHVWERYHAGGLAVSLDRADAQLASDIGDANFGHEINYNPGLAKRAFEKAVSIEPGILWGHYQIARILFVQGKFVEALAEINKELQYNPTNLRSLYVRGLIYAYSGDLTDAIGDFTSFVAWAPSEWAGYNDLAWVLGRNGAYVNAEQVLTDGLAKAAGAQTNVWLWNNLGVQQLNLGQYRDAITSFTKAQKLAAELTPDEWRQSYPGNDPSGDQQGIEQFQAAVASNLAKAEQGIGS